MPLPRLTERLEFPPVTEANEDGELAVGGDLSVARLRLAYRHGIFPWPVWGCTLRWVAPDPRWVLVPAEAHISHSLKPLLKRGYFEVTIDRAFRDVITACRLQRRPGQPGTWITRDMLEAYCALHEAGDAHSIELWRDGALAGGLYGVRTGRVFSGESVFHRVSNAGKYAIATLTRLAPEWGVSLIDCQMCSPLLAPFGPRPMPRAEYLAWLA